LPHRAGNEKASRLAGGFRSVGAVLFPLAARAISCPRKEDLENERKDYAAVHVQRRVRTFGPKVKVAL